MDTNTTQSNNSNPNQINQDWFMRHKWFFAALVFVIVGAGIVVQLKINYYRNNLKIDLPVHIEKQPTPAVAETPAQQVMSDAFNIPFKVGDIVGDMKVVSIEPFFPERNYPINEDNYKIKFDGEVIISGEYMMDSNPGPGCAVRFLADEESESKMPKVRVEHKFYFCPIIEENIKNENFGADGTGRFTAVIDEYELQGCGCEGFNSARVVKLISVLPDKK